MKEPKAPKKEKVFTFQSPRSGKFESNKSNQASQKEVGVIGFNPLDRGNLNQILTKAARLRAGTWSFNPLNRGNLNQMSMDARFEAQVAEMFQSPKSGKFESNSA